MTQASTPTRQALALIVLTETMDGEWAVDLFAEPSTEMVPPCNRGEEAEHARHHASWVVAECSKDQVITHAGEHLNNWGYRPPAGVSYRYVWLPHPWDELSYQAPIETGE